MNEWIPVSERLPGIDEYVLVCDILNCIYIGRRYDSETVFFKSVTTNVVTKAKAWMPLPAPYKESDNNDH